MESKHTPGPWKSAETFANNAPSTWNVYAKPEPGSKRFNGECVAVCETPANAALIAAAPDMLYALSETADRLSAWSDSLREWVNHDIGTPEKREERTNEADNYDWLLSLIMPALAKAEGR